MLLVAIDWGTGWIRIRRGGWESVDAVDEWVRETVKKGEAVADWGGVVPGFSLVVPVWQRLIQVRLGFRVHG